ncbi:MAG TPA: tryptophan--tRNA ligase [Candidatus Limnocylindrales bacterium]|nr:tryptophan--tRNA ligase [Candidatus Limnocylindrales bacterium]
MPEATGRPRVFSGIQPSGFLHIGNYLGAIRNWVRDQERYENIFCIVDLHALTLPIEPAVLREQRLDLAATLIAAGIDPLRSALFLQSDIPAHSEMAWILECFTPMGWLERMTQFKEKAGRQSHERIGAGLLHYPALMAADILLYDTNLVPVGEDQRQHLELTRDLARRMNQRYGEIFVVPEALIREAGARIMGLDDPGKKMSKSIAAAAPGHAIGIMDPPDVIRKKFARAQTDTEPAVRFPAGAGVNNLLEIYRTVRERSWDEVKAEFEGKQYSALKQAVADAVIEVLGPVQERYRAVRQDDAAMLRALEASAQRIRPVAEATLRRVQEAVGLR